MIIFSCVLIWEENINAKSLIMYDDIASAPKGKESERRGGAGWRTELRM